MSGFDCGANRSRSHVALQLGPLRQTMSELFPVRFLFHPFCLGTASGLLRRPAPAKLLLCLWPRSGSGSPGPVPPEKQLLLLGAAPTRLRVPETDGQNKEKRMYLNRITLIGFLGADAEKKVSNATNIAVFSLATKTSWKNDAGTWESRTEWHRCVAFGQLAEFAATLSRGAHVAVVGELRSHDYQREVVLGTQKTAITQRVWEICVDSVLKLDRAVNGASDVDSHAEVPR
jgi:single-strand DNA-binding protein